MAAVQELGVCYSGTFTKVHHPSLSKMYNIVFLYVDIDLRLALKEIGWI